MSSVQTETYYQRYAHTHLPALPLLPPLLLLPAGGLYRRLCWPLLPLQGTHGALQAGQLLLQVALLHKGERRLVFSSQAFCAEP